MRVALVAPLVPVALAVAAARVARANAVAGAAARVIMALLKQAEDVDLVA